MLGWLLYEHGIEPHVTVFDKSARTDGTFPRKDFTYDHAGDVYRCPGGKTLTTTGTLVNDEATILYRASKHDCQACSLRSRCCPNTPARKVPRSIYEGARDMAREIARSWEGRTSRRLRKKIEMLFAHLKRILKLDRLRLRGPNGARDEFILAATAQNLRKMAKLLPMPSPRPAWERTNRAPSSALAPLHRITAGLFQQNRPKCEVPTGLRKVRFQGRTGRHLLSLSSSQFDPERRQTFTRVKGTTCATRSCGSVVGFQQKPAEEGDEVPLDGKERQ